MKFEELIKDRYSCRKFKNTPVEKERLKKYLKLRLLQNCLQFTTAKNFSVNR